ncbi:MAG: hypothetical protein R2822_15990 [Spirosomataceae bacterium]
MVGAFTLSNAGNVLKLIIEYTMFGTSTYPLVAAILSVLWLVAIWVQIDSSEKLIAHGRKLYPQAFGLKAT